MRRFPLSLVFFLATGVVFLLQLFPVTGIFLMFMLAAFWSVALINAGMIGIAVEVVTRQVSWRWLIVPLGFYGLYYAVAYADHQTLAALRVHYATANAAVAVPFDPARQALVFESESNSGGWLVQNYRLPVAYSTNRNSPEGFRSNRMMAHEICARVRDTPSLGAAGVYSFGFHDGDDIYHRKMDGRFCDLGMPERPTLPLVQVARRETKTQVVTLPITRVTRTVTTPDGRQFELLGGVAGPLSWIPMPVMGCFLDSGTPAWRCDAGFWRDSGTPILSGTTRYSRDDVALARALRLKRVAIADRVGGDETLVRAKLAEVEAATLARQSAAVDAMIANPTAKVVDWDTGVLANRPEALAAKADAIMTGLERAAAVTGAESWRAREGGRILAQLIARLDRDRFVGYGPRLLALYRANFAPIVIRGSSRDSHWLWEGEPLLRRLGDLGPTALFVAVDPRARDAGVEAMCRIGSAGAAKSGPVLLDRWRALNPYERDQRRALFVALRRVGITPPPIVESAEERSRRERGNRAFGGVFAQQLSPMQTLVRDWGDITPDSPSRVCSSLEVQARQEEKHGPRKTNLE